ncbi:MAG: carboxypeptidase regulatory-like domain-containing protein [Acidobacteria bacterium]|nr:carboxypeptidase regulatory-like domain-containing protein [Acidobacteriota bacterium]
MISVKPHTTSVVVWEIPSPVAMGSPFKIKVGVKCLAACQLTGQSIVVYDERGAKVAAGKLGETPWPQTSGLYWVEVGMTAPAVEGVYSWTAKFLASGLDLPHENASFSFSFRTARPPEHTVTVGVVDKNTKTSIKDADLRLNTYRASTNEDGMAKVRVPKGKYKLHVSKDGYETFQTTVEVTDDVTIKVLFVVKPKGCCDGS